MARQRLISPEFFMHAELYEAEEASGLPLRLAFSALWCQSDRRGVFVWKPRELKFACLPHDACDFAAVLSALEQHGFVKSYTVQGRRYGVIPSFARWQTFHVREAPSKNPGPSEADADSVPAPAVHQTKQSLARAQHRASTMLAPDKPGASTPVTVTVTGSVTGTGTVVSYVHAADGEHRKRLADAVNQGITDRFGEQPNPIRWDQKGTWVAAERLEAARVPLDFACAKVYEFAKSRVPSSGQPPKTLTYYDGAVIEAWRAEEAHRSAAVAPVPVADPAEVIDFTRRDTIAAAQYGDVVAQAECDAAGWVWRKGVA